VIVVFIGPPGSGKGTQAEIICSKTDFTKLSSGDIIRDEINNKTELGQQLEDIVNKGDLVPDDMMQEILQNKLENIDSHVILDGYPRTVGQAKKLSNYFSSESNIIAVNFNVAEDILIKRITGRYACKSCGANYNKYYNNTVKQNICDKCGGNEFKVRQDDNEEVLKSRLEDYNNITKKVIDYYKNNGSLYNIDATAAIEEITEDILSVIKNY
jgi:adenylate kinase